MVAVRSFHRMSPTDSDRSEQSTDSTRERSRRDVLKLTGAGVGVGGLAGVGALGAGQEDGGAGTNQTGNETDGGEEMQSGGALVDDLVDPTFGYPLASDESDAVSLGTVVEADHREGGAHEGFPQQPGPEGGEFPVEFVFDPVGVRVTPEEVVHFLSVAGEHTVTAMSEKYANPQLAVPTRIPEGSPGFTSPPIVGGESWLYQFTETGVYDVLCLPHYVFGMVMRLVVIDPEEGDIEDEQFSVDPAEGVPPNVAAVLNAPELAPSNIVEQGSVAWADLTLDGSAGEPTGTPADGADGDETAGNETEG